MLTDRQLVRHTAGQMSEIQIKYKDLILIKLQTWFRAQKVFYFLEPNPINSCCKLRDNCDSGEKE